jgi:hypothetical protein
MLPLLAIMPTLASHATHAKAAIPASVAIPAGVAYAATAATSAIPATLMSSTCLAFQPLRRLPVPLAASQKCVSRLRYVVHLLLDALALPRPLFRPSLSLWHAICWQAAALHLHVNGAILYFVLHIGVLEDGSLTSPCSDQVILSPKQAASALWLRKSAQTFLL